MGYIECEHFAVKLSADHEDITGTEIVLRLLVHAELDDRGIEIERNGLAFLDRDRFGKVLPLSIVVRLRR